MISNLVINQQKFVLFIDNVGMERFSDRIVRKLLAQQGQDSVQTVPPTIDVKLNSTRDDIEPDLSQLHSQTNIILQPLSNLLITYNAGSVFQLVNRLKKDSNAKQIFLWATVKNVSEHFVIPFLEYMSDLIVTLVDSNHLSIVTRKAGGLIASKFYQYQLRNGDFTVKEIKKTIQKPIQPAVDPESLGTFKINLDDEELVARNALKLPYERTSDAPKESEILYTPDADDDFDDEDPDEDLYI